MRETQVISGISKESTGLEVNVQLNCADLQMFSSADETHVCRWYRHWEMFDVIVDVVSVCCCTEMDFLPSSHSLSKLSFNVYAPPPPLSVFGQKTLDCIEAGNKVKMYPPMVVWILGPLILLFWTFSEVYVVWTTGMDPLSCKPHTFLRCLYLFLICQENWMIGIKLELHIRDRNVHFSPNFVWRYQTMRTKMLRDTETYNCSISCFYSAIKDRK